MCGFVGGSNPAWDYRAGLAAIEHRGPDATGLHQQGLVHVGFQRLSIIDLAEHANQPMFAGEYMAGF